MNALPLGSRFLAHLVGTVTLIWRSMLRAALIAGGIGLLLAEIGDCVAAHHFPPSGPAQFVAVALIVGLGLAAAATVCLIEVIGAVAETVRKLEGDAVAGLNAAEALAALEAGRLFTRHPHAENAAPAAHPAPVRQPSQSVSRAPQNRGSTGGPASRSFSPAATYPPSPSSTSQQRGPRTAPLASSTATSDPSSTSTYARPRTIGDVANRARPAAGASAPQRADSAWLNEGSRKSSTGAPVGGTTAQQPNAPITPFAEGEMVPQLPPLPVRADKLPRIGWANVESTLKSSAAADPQAPTDQSASGYSSEDQAHVEATSTHSEPAPIGDAADNTMPSSMRQSEGQTHHSDHGLAAALAGSIALGAAGMLGAKVAEANAHPEENTTSTANESAHEAASDAPPAHEKVASAAPASEPLQTDPPLVAPTWGAQFEESAISSDTPTIVPTLTQRTADPANPTRPSAGHPGIPAGMAEPADPTLPRRSMPTRPLSRALVRPSGPFDVPEQGGGLWERLGQALRGQLEHVPAAPPTIPDPTIESTIEIGVADNSAPTSGTDA